MKYGIDTLWFNKRGIELPKGFRPTYRMNKLEEIFGILELE